MRVEIQNLKNKNENLVFEKTSLKEEVLMLKTKVKTGTDNISTEQIQKLNSEIEHLKRGINLLKSQNKEKDNSMRHILNEKDKLSNEYRNVINKNNEIKKEYDELKLKLHSKDKEIDKLKKQIIVSSKVVNKPKMSAEEAKQKFSKMYREIFEKLKKIAFTTKVIQGQNIRELANEINKMAGRFGNSHSSDEVKQLLSEFILKLCNLHRLLENNSKESGLDEYIDLLRKLEAKL